MLVKLPSLRMSSALELAEMLLKSAAEFGRYVSNVADSSISGLMIPWAEKNEQIL